VRTFIAGMMIGVVIPGLIILVYWLDVVLHGGRLKPAIVLVVTGTTVSALLLSIVLDPFAAKYILPPYALLFLLSWLYYKWRHPKKEPPYGGPYRRVPAQAKRLAANLGREEELPRKSADGRSGGPKGQLA
jgi:hypothetical protein